MHAWTEIPPYGQGGLVVAALTLVAASVMLLASPDRDSKTSRNARPLLESLVSRGSPALLYALAGLALIPVISELALSTWYLFSPTYIDHIEASTASIAQYFLRGVPLYPSTNAYTFHALIYGPLLAEANAAGYLLGSGVAASKLIGWGAAWLAVATLLFSVPRGGRDWTWVVGGACALCVLTSFGPILTANRADSLLLLCATLALFCVIRLPGLGGWALVGALAGAASALKLHGLLYVVPAFFIGLCLHGEPRSWRAAIGAAAAAGAVAALLPFLPANVTIGGYLTYLKLAAHHGLEWWILGTNCAFVAGLWSPVLLIWSIVPSSFSAATGVRQIPRMWLLALLGAELLVAVIASKPGAGVHHLLPFLGYHAFLVQRLLKRAEYCSTAAPSVALVCLAAVLLGTAWPAGALLRNFLEFDLKLPDQEAAHAELERWASRYPQGMMGVADRSSYNLTSLRPWLTLRGVQQTDYGALMDWKLSGVSDAPLVNALEQCAIPELFVPKGGEPFSMTNGYGGPLFSDAVLETFARHYSLVSTGRFFVVFACHA